MCIRDRLFCDNECYDKVYVMLYQLLVELMKGNETRGIIQLLLQNDVGSS